MAESPVSWELLIASAIKWLGLVLFGMSIFNTVNSIVSSVTGVSPTAMIASQVTQTIIPFMIQMMPLVMVVSMMASMMSAMIAPFRRLAWAI